MLILWTCEHCWWMRVGGVGQKSYLGPAETTFFSSQDFSQSNKHDIFWNVVSTGYFYIVFLWTIAVSDFCTLDIYKNLCFPLSTITYKVNSHAGNYFYKINIFICLKYYTVWNQFLLKYMLKFWPKFLIFKFDLNVECYSYFF